MNSKLFLTFCLCLMLSATLRAENNGVDTLPNPAKLKLGLSTDSRGLTGVGGAAPSFKPKNQYYPYSWVDTSANITWQYSVQGRWVANGDLKQALPPIPTTSTYPGYDRRVARWVDTDDNNEHVYNYSLSAWVPDDGIHIAASAPTDISSGGSNGAAVYSKSFWYDSVNSTLKKYNGSSWVDTGDGSIDTTALRTDINNLQTLTGQGDGSTSLGVMSQGTQYPDNPTIKTFADSTDAKATRFEASRHEAATVLDGATVDFTLSGQQITGEVKSTSLDSTHLKTGGVGNTDLAPAIVSWSKLAQPVKDSIAAGGGSTTRQDTIQALSRTLFQDPVSPLISEVRKVVADSNYSVNTILTYLPPIQKKNAGFSLFPRNVFQNTARYVGFPAVVKGNQNDLLMLYADGVSHVDGQNTVFGRSVDGGISWDTTIVGVSQSNTSIEFYSGSLIENNDTIWVWYRYNFDSNPGGSYIGIDSSKIFYRFSVNKGNTFSAPATTFRPPGVNIIALADASPAVKTKTGRILIPFYTLTVSGATSQAGVFYADNRDYAHPTYVYFPNPADRSPSEVSLVVDRDTIWALMRTNDSPTQRIYRSFSVNDGVSWATIAATSHTTDYKNCQPNTILLPDGRMLITARFGTLQTPGYMISYNKGLTWPDTAKFSRYNDAFLYGSWVLTSPNTLALIYSEENTPLGSYISMMNLEIPGKAQWKVKENGDVAIVSTLSGTAVNTASLISNFTYSAGPGLRLNNLQFELGGSAGSYAFGSYPHKLTGSRVLDLNGKTFTFGDATENNLLRISGVADKVSIGRDSLYLTGAVAQKLNLLGNFNIESSNGSNSLYIGINSGVASGTSGNNTGVGANSLQTNTTGTANTAIGFYSQRLSTAITQLSAVGGYSFEQNTGSFCSGVGFRIGRFNTAASLSGVGLEFGLNNTGASLSGIGAYAATNNTGANVSVLGVNAGFGNKGADAAFFGRNAGFANQGASNLGFGPYANQSNTKTNTSAVGYYAHGAGDAASGVFSGSNAGKYTNGSNNTAIGAEAFNTGTVGSFVAATVNTTTEQFTVTAHGFGANGTKVPCRVQAAGSPQPMTSGLDYLFNIVDANTLQPVNIDMTTAGTTVTIALITVSQYSNSTALGYDAEPDSSYQAVIGNANIKNLKIGNRKIQVNQTLGAGQDGWLLGYNNSLGKSKWAALTVAQIPDLSATYLKHGANTLTQNTTFNGTFDWRMGNSTALDTVEVKAASVILNGTTATELFTNGTKRVTLDSGGGIRSNTVTDWKMNPSDSAQLQVGANGWLLSTAFGRYVANGIIAWQVNHSTGASASIVPDNTATAYSMNISGGATMILVNTTDGAEVLTLGSSATGATTAFPAKPTGKIAGGLYTPTITLSGADTILNTYTARYHRIDSVLIISGSVRIGHTVGSTAESFTVSLPPGYTTDLTSQFGDVSGTVGVNQSDTYTVGLSRLLAHVEADTTADKPLVNYEPIGTGGVAKRNRISFELTLTLK